jgi:hypothetical protein
MISDMALDHCELRVTAMKQIRKTEHPMVWYGTCWLRRSFVHSDHDRPAANGA